MITFTTIGRYMANRFVVTILGVFFLMLLLIFFVDFVEVLRSASRHEDMGPGYARVYLSAARPNFRRACPALCGSDRDHWRIPQPEPELPS